MSKIVVKSCRSSWHLAKLSSSSNTWVPFCNYGSSFQIGCSNRSDRTSRAGEDAQFNEEKSLESPFCEQNTAKTWAGKRVLHNTNFQTLLAKDAPPPVILVQKSRNLVSSNHPHKNQQCSAVPVRSSATTAQCPTYCSSIHKN